MSSCPLCVFSPPVPPPAFIIVSQKVLTQKKDPSRDFTHWLLSFVAHGLEALPSYRKVWLGLQENQFDTKNVKMSNALKCLDGPSRWKVPELENGTCRKATQNALISALKLSLNSHFSFPKPSLVCMWATNLSPTKRFFTCCQWWSMSVACEKEGGDLWKNRDFPYFFIYRKA